MTPTARTAAAGLLARGFVPIPVHPRTKRPIGDAWESLTPGRVRDRFDALFPENATDRNVGVLNGEPSGGFVDVDLDTPMARVAARFFLPPTGMKWGRASAPDSHHGYRVDNPPAKAAENFDGPDGWHVLEIRGTGGHTLVPPSIAPADPEHGKVEEPVVWSAEGGPARVPMAELTVAVGRVAAATLVAGKWPKGSRHAAALALSGGLLQCGWAVADVTRFVRAVCAAAADDEVDDRVRCVTSTAEAVAGKQPTSGWPAFCKLFGDAVTRTVRRWLGIADPSAKGLSRPRYVPLPPYVPFPTHCLPAPWDAFVREGARALKCDEAYVALPVIAALAGAVGISRRVYLGGEWYEPAVFWVCVVAESGTLKSPAADLVIGLVKARQKRLVAAHKAAMTCYRQDLADHKRRARDGDEPGDPPEKPVMARCLVGDVTIEKLAGLLDDNRRGLLVYRDELAGWLGSFCKYKAKGAGSDEPNWLSLYRADVLIYDRKTGDKTSVFVPHAAVSVVGSIQPGKLAALMGAECFDSGLVARINFAMPPRTPKRYVKDGIPADLKAAAATSLESLSALEAEPDEDGDFRPVLVRLGSEAEVVVEDFVNRWGLRQFEADGERAAALSKLEAVPARFGLLRHLVRNPTGLTMAAEDLRAGIALAEWLANECDRVYQMLAENDVERKIRKLIDHVRRVADRHGGQVTAAELQRSSKKYASSEEAEAALDSLVSLGVGEWVPVPAGPTGGRPSRAFRFHPEADADETDETPPGSSDDPAGSRNDAADETPLPSKDNPCGTEGPVADLPSFPANPTTGSTSTQAAETGSVGFVGVGHERDRGFPPDADLEAGGRKREGCVGASGIVLASDSDGVNLLAGGIEDWGGAIALDVETTGLDPEGDRVRLVQVAFNGNVTLVDAFALPEPASALAQLFEAMRGVEVVGHNLQFDLRFLAKLGFVPGRVFCTMLASQVLHAGERDENRHGRLKHSLEAVVERELGLKLNKNEQASDWSRPQLTPDQLRYAADDVRHLPALAETFKGHLASANLTATAELEMRALKGVAWTRPVAVDTAAWTSAANSAESERNRLAEEMDAVAPNRTTLTASRNWNSPDEVKAAFTILGIGLTNTDDDTLAEVDHPLAGLLRRYRAAAKRAGSCGARWLADHAPHGFVSASWNQLGAGARMSCSSPNLQQIPRGAGYRKCFVARPGHVLVKADYSQIELRVAAVVAGEARMIEAYAKGDDLHALTAATLTGKPVTDVVKADRQLAKAVNFGLLYGMGWKSLGRYAASNYGVTLTDDEAKRHRAAFFRAYPRIRSWHSRVDHWLEATIRQNPDAVLLSHTRGTRRRAIPAAKTTAGGRAYPNLNEHLNFPVQGTAADGMKAAIALLWERRDRCPGAVPVLFVHDEIVVEVPEADADAAKDWLVAAMADGMQPLIPGVPAVVEACIAKTWGG